MSSGDEPSAAAAERVRTPPPQARDARAVRRVLVPGCARSGTTYAEAVHEGERRPFSREEVPRSHAVDFRKVRPEAGKERCLGHAGNVSFVHGLGRGAEPLSRSAQMEGRA